LQTRLKRPLLAVAVTGAIFATGAVLSAPASAATPILSDEPTATASSTDEATPAADSTTEAPAADATTDSTPSPSADATTDSTPSPSVGPDDSGTTPADNPPTTTEPADVAKPTGTVKLNYTSLWVGQRSTLTLSGVSDDHSVGDGIKRVVSWGDGTTTILSSTTISATKQYSKAGKFAVSVTLTDEAGNAAVVKPASGVTVTVPGKVKLSTTSVWHGQKFNVTFSSVPSGTTKIVLNEGDGYVATLKGKNQTVPSMYYHRYKGALMPAGPVTLTATYTNKQGTTTPIVIGKVTIKKDSWNPHVTVTKPKHSERVSSWKTIHGTATDKGSGVHDVIVVPMRASGSKVYCYTYKKKWIRLYSDSDVAKCGVVVGVKKGKWSLGLKGLTKGEFTVIAVGEDWSDRASNVAQVTKKLTHS